MDRKLMEIERLVLGQPEIISGFAAIDMEERGQVNSGIGFFQMKKPHLRQATQAEVVQRLRRELAAIEGVWETERGAPLLLFALPDEEARENDYAIGVPKLASFILTHDFNGEIRGLDEFEGTPAPDQFD